MLNSFRGWEVFFLITMFFAASKAQVILEDELDRLDSLLVKQDDAGIADFFAIKEVELKSSKFNQKEIEDFKTTKESCLSTVKNLVAVNALTEERRALLIEQSLKYARDYDEAFAGKKAADFYKNFMTLAQVDDKSGALKSYYLAKHFYAKHRRGILQWIEVTLDKSRQKFTQKEYDEAYALVQQIESNAKPAALLEAYRTEIKFLKRKIENELARIKAEKEFFGQTDLPEHSWSVYVGGSFLLHGSIKNIRWEVSRFSTLSGDLLEQYEYGFDDRAKWGLGFSGDITRAVTSKLQIGVNVIYSNYSYKTLRPYDGRGIEYIDYRLTYRAASLTLNYFFREQVGIRPFFGLGVGGAQVNREQLDGPRGIVYCCVPERVPKEEITTSYLIMDTGLDYIPRAKSRIVYKFFMGTNYNLHPAKLLSRMTFASGFKIGVGF